MNAAQGQEKHRQNAGRRAMATVTGVVAAGVVAAGVLAAACSSGPSAPSVASLPGHQGAHAAAGQLTQAQSDQDMVNFARCMRAHGVNVPDPFHRPGHAGLSIAIPGPTQAPGAPAALRACNHFLAPIIQMKQAGQAAIAARELPALTNYARCMRAHDIPMLDPNTLGQLNLGHVPGISGNFGRYTPQFHAADAACRHLLPPGVADNGTGP